MILFYCFVSLFLFLLLLVGMLYCIQEKFIFLNGEKIAKEYIYQFKNDFEEIFIQTEANAEINALHFKLNNPKGVVLFCHGNKGNLKKWGTRVGYFLKYNYEVLVFDYRNYGKSSGKFNEEKMYTDALLVYNYLKSYFSEDKIVVYGFSIGSTFATRIASKNNPKELILEAPFFNFKKAIQYHSKIIPTFIIKYQFNTNKDIINVICPITIFHGNKDVTTSHQQSKELINLQKSSKNQYILIDGGTHHNIKEYPIYKKKLQEILNR